MLIRPRVAMVLEMGEAGAERAGGARAAELVALRAISRRRARFYARNRAALRPRRGRAIIRCRALDLEALMPVVEGRMPLIVKVDRASDIRRDARAGAGEGLRIILDGAAEGWRVADEIAARRRAGARRSGRPTCRTASSELGATLRECARGSTRPAYRRCSRPAAASPTAPASCATTPAMRSPTACRTRRRWRRSRSIRRGSSASPTGARLDRARQGRRSRALVGRPVRAAVAAARDLHPTAPRSRSPRARSSCAIAISRPASPARSSAFAPGPSESSAGI